MDPKPHPLTVPGLLLLVAVGLAGNVLLRVMHTPALSDEGAHSEQIRTFCDGSTALDPKLTTIPGYHALMAALAYVAGDTTLPTLRLLSTLLGLLAVVVFVLLARRIETEAPRERGLHYLFLPLLLPFVFLVYTDPLGLLLLLACLLMVAAERPVWAGLLGLASLLVRQTNVVWLACFVVWDYLRTSGWRWSTRSALDHAARHAALLGCLLAFLVFTAWNGGVALGDRAMHPLGIYSGNAWFFLLACALTFAPLLLAKYRDVLGLLATPRGAALAAGLFALYWFTFASPHPYNHYPGHLRNGALMAAEQSAGVRARVFVPMGYAAVALCFVRLARSADYIIYAFALLALLPAPLIEQRYALVPLALLLLFRERASTRVERVSLAYEALLSAFLLSGFARDSFFL